MHDLELVVEDWHYVRVLKMFHVRLFYHFLLSWSGNLL